MPLTWDLGKCADWESLKSDDEWAVTEVIIFGTMHTGIGKITEANAGEFYARMHFLEQLNGDMLLFTRNGERVRRPLMPLDIKKRIGLVTNASFKDETRASFVRRHVTNGAIKDGTYKWSHAVRNDFKGSEYEFILPETEPASDLAAS